MSRILITGHRGLLGSACVRQFSKSHEILTLETSLTDERYVGFWFAENQPEGVIHCAAKVGGVKANRDNPVSFLIDNVTIQNNVLRAAAENGVKKLVNIATSCLYPHLAPVPVKEDSLLTGPFSPDVESYAIAKLAGYGLCRAYRSQSGKDFVTVAPCNLYGPNDNYGPSAHVIPSLIDKFDKAQTDGSNEIKVWGDGSAIREFLHSDDAACAIETVYDKYSSPEIINIGHGHPASIRYLVESISIAYGYHPNVIWDNSQPVGIQEKTFSAEKLISLGWSPKIGLVDGLKMTIKDFLENPRTRRK